MSGCRATERPQKRSVSFFTGKLSGDTRIHQSWLVSQHFYGGWIEMDRNAFGFRFRCEPLWKEHKSIKRTSTWRHWIDLAGVLNGSSSLYVPGWRAYSGAKGLCVGFLTALDSIDSRDVTNSGNESSMSQMNATHYIFRGDWVWISSLEMSESGIKGLISIWSTIEEQLVEISICTLIVSNICTSIQATNTLGVAQPAESHTVILLLSKNCSNSNLKLEMTTASPFTSFKCANLRVKPRHLGHGSSWWRHSGRALRPWKIIFAFIPPTDYCGGQGCEFSGFWSYPFAVSVTTATAAIFSWQGGFAFASHWFSLAELSEASRAWGNPGVLGENQMTNSSNHPSIEGINIIILWYIHGEREYFLCLVRTVTAHSHIPKDEWRNSFVESYRLFRNHHLLCGSGERALSLTKWLCQPFGLLESTTAQV